MHDRDCRQLMALGYRLRIRLLPGGGRICFLQSPSGSLEQTHVIGARQADRLRSSPDVQYVGTSVLGTDVYEFLPEA